MLGEEEEEGQGEEDWEGVRVRVPREDLVDVELKHKVGDTEGEPEREKLAVAV